eukprot:Nk52_evm33s2133 gene=Nk52_evmTU33s2133
MKKFYSALVGVSLLLLGGGLVLGTPVPGPKEATTCNSTSGGNTGQICQEQRNKCITKADVESAISASDIDNNKRTLLRQKLNFAIEHYFLENRVTLSEDGESRKQPKFIGLDVTGDTPVMPCSSWHKTFMCNSSLEFEYCERDWKWSSKDNKHIGKITFKPGTVVVEKDGVVEIEDSSKLCTGRGERCVRQKGKTICKPAAGFKYAISRGKLVMKTSQTDSSVQVPQILECTDAEKTCKKLHGIQAIAEAIKKGSQMKFDSQVACACDAYEGELAGDCACYPHKELSAWGDC